MAVYHGKRGKLYMSTSGSGTPANVTKVVDWTINREMGEADATTMSDDNKVYVLGLPDYSMELSFVWDDTIDTFFDASDSTDGVKFYLYPSRDVATKYLYGAAWFSLNDLSGGTEDAVKGTAKMLPNGAWTWN